MLRRVLRRWLNLASGSATRAPQNARDSGFHPVTELLESREVLSTISWLNEGFDGFETAFGAAGAESARAVVREAIADWEVTISSFNYPPGGFLGIGPLGGGGYLGTGNYGVKISVGDLAPNRLAETTTNLFTWSPITGTWGPPSYCEVTIDRDAAATSGGWYIDPVPGDNAEFTSLNNRFSANGSMTGTDLYTVVLHELGHGMGFDAGLVPLATRVTPTSLPDPVPPAGGASTLGTVVLADGTAVAVVQGGAHVAIPTVTGAGMGRPNDLMNTMIGASERRLISDLDARILRDVYGYTVTLPSTRETFLVNPDLPSGFVTVNADPEVFADQFTVTNAGDTVVVRVNDVTAGLKDRNVNGVVLRASNEPNTITLDRALGDRSGALAGRGIWVNGGSDRDVVNVFAAAGSRVTVATGAGADAVAVRSAAVGSSVKIDGGSGSDRFEVRGSDAGSYVEIRTGDETGVPEQVLNVVEVGGANGPVGGLTTVRGATKVIGGGGRDILEIQDGEYASGRDFRLTSVTFDWTSPFAASTITFMNLDEVNVTLGSGDDMVAVWATPPGAATTLIDRNGTDTLDYSRFGGPVYVNLLTGEATGLRFHSGFENVIGGSGADILVGDGNDNLLSGGGGNDVLIGGLGWDVLFGEDGRDIVIGGYTDYDWNASALFSIRDTWNVASDTPAGVSALRGVLNPATVHREPGLDRVLHGGDDRDWIWGLAAYTDFTADDFWEDR